MKNIIIRVILFLAGVLCLVFVVWLGLKTADNTSYVVWFGLASAIIAPIGLTFLTLAFTLGSNDALKRLSAVPDIQKLIEKANTEQERIRVLQEQRDQLEDVIRLESHRQALLARKDKLQEEGVQILTDLESVDAELAAVDKCVAVSPWRDDISRLQERLKARQKGSIVLHFGSRHITIDRDLIIGLPFGRFILWYLRMIQTILGNLRKANKSEGPNVGDISLGSH